MSYELDAEAGLWFQGTKWSVLTSEELYVDNGYPIRWNDESQIYSDGSDLYIVSGVGDIILNPTGGGVNLNGNLDVGGVPTSTAYNGASLIVNPATATADYLLQSWSVGNVIKASIDEDGDLDIGGDLDVTGDVVASSQIATTTETVATLGVGVTTFAITNNVSIVTGDGGGNTVATITGGLNGQLLTLMFTDANVAITDTDAHGANTVDLSAAFTSADDTVLQLVYDGTSWYEASRSVN